MNLRSIQIDSDLLCFGYNSSAYCIRYNFLVSVSISTTFFSQVSVSSTFSPVSAKVFATFLFKPLQRSQLLFRYFLRFLARIFRVLGNFWRLFADFREFWQLIETLHENCSENTFKPTLTNCYSGGWKRQTQQRKRSGKVSMSATFATHSMIIHYYNQFECKPVSIQFPSANRVHYRVIQNLCRNQERCTDQS